MLGSLLAALVLVVGCPAPGAASIQGPRERKALGDFEEERERALIEIGQRHLEYGLELREKGLPIQAAAQLALAVDASRGKNQAARHVLGLMRRFEDAFWKRRHAEPTPARLAAYAKEARELRERDVRDRLALVRLADRRGLDGRAFEELSELLLEIDEPLAFDERGALAVAGETLRGPLAERARAEAIEIDGRPYPRDLLARRVPAVTRLFEASSPELRVRSTTSREEAERVHRAASAVLPLLARELGLVPERRLQVFVLGERAHYRSYLDIASLSSHAAADGFADRVAGAAVLCSAGRDGERFTDERVSGLALHELTHLLQLAVSPAAFPSWYAEGQAEAFGGEGTFRFEGDALVPRGDMAAARLAEVRAAPLPLRELLAADALELLARDRAAARRFYAQSWAFLRFLEGGAGPDVAERLARWRSMCLGALLGADLYDPYAMDAAKSRELFLELFEKDLERLEGEFAAWLAAR